MARSAQDRGPQVAGVRAWLVPSSVVAGVLAGGLAVALGVRLAPFHATDLPRPQAADASAGGWAEASVRSGSEPRGEAGDEPPSPSVERFPDVVARTRGAALFIKAFDRRGSGVVVSRRGVVLATFEDFDAVLRALPRAGPGAGERDAAIHAVFENGRELPAELLVADHRARVALLRVVGADTSEAPEAFPAAELGQVPVPVGGEVFAFVHPRGLPHTVTRGILAATDRTGILPDKEIPLLQVDPGLDPGGAGGPLFDLEGRLAGFLLAGRHAGSAFAVPAGRIRAFVRAVDQGQELRSGAVGMMLGATVEAPPKAQSEGISRCLLVDEVTPEGPAAQAGLRAGDCLVEVRGRRISGGSEAHVAFVQTVRALLPGEGLQVTAVRDDGFVAAEITVGPASLERQAQIDAEELLGVRLSSTIEEGQLRVAGFLKGGALARDPRASQLVGGRIVQLFDRPTPSPAVLGETLSGLRALVRQQGEVMVAVTFETSTEQRLGFVVRISA